LVIKLVEEHGNPVILAVIFYKFEAKNRKAYSLFRRLNIWSFPLMNIDEEFKRVAFFSYRNGLVVWRRIFYSW
jgi:hypothetical protein